ncbi:amidohydrolase [Candidatus Kaiserbacteria bacterium CG10_big_fil_rev_8_21_14_0_10_59_10]|uniref:Amidohydrolase n=1 Tax=Candidatus Kaiserbacteria bacterium CG10_big_fil_rev_8_21_14_0_10_59_10 TaxID=1974612 RepID=A0A2H0U8P2_9BACT|nr:MAG: amidohydrolase [Candidatus Kaiserbacteria bacterium CG10_big_fil_rev_8_21_14_0_10_59_10]
MANITIEGRIATHDAKPFRGRIDIDEKTGLISSVAQAAKRGGRPAAHVYGDECLIFAGFGDVHIHAREDDTGKQNYKEEYATAANAALGGGVVHVCAMPNTPNPVVGKSQFAWHRSRVGTLRHAVSILNYVGIDAKTKPLGKPGEHMYKLYFGKSVGTLTVTYAGELDEILSRYKGHNISFHVEYEPIVQAHAHGKTHTERRPAECVNEGLRLLLPLIEKHGIRAKLCHWSTGGESFEMIAEYRARGCDIVLEVSPLHLLFDTSMTDQDPSLWLKIQMNPAVQSPEHRRALIRALKEGFIQFLATDHAPHTVEEKHSAFAKFRQPEHARALKGMRVHAMGNKELAEAVRAKDEALFLETCCENNQSGAPWLDTYGLVCAWLINEHGFTPQEVARAAAFNPGRFVNAHLKRQFPRTNFGKGFGEVKKGFMGSLTVLNVKKKTRITRDMLKTKVGWSALEGRIMPGAVEAVFIRGKR